MPVPNQQKGVAGKVSVDCPHCRASQLESVFAKSTICRSCGRGFDIGRTRSGQPQGITDAPAEDLAGGVSLFARAARLFKREKIRRIQCFGCGASQSVSSLAKSSLCPQCGAYIDLRDFRINSAFSRVIQTQGMVFVTRWGDLASPRVACREAVIRGNLHGSLLCTGTARFKLTGRLVGQCECNELIIEKGAKIEFVRPLKARVIHIFGTLSAQIHADTVLIGNKGDLEGTVHAKAISVEKGGIFRGELFIGQRELVQAELIGPGQNLLSCTPDPTGAPLRLRNAG